MQIADALDPCLCHQRVPHAPAGGELLAVRRYDIPAEIWIIRFDDQMVVRVVGIGQDDMDVMVAFRV